VHEGAAVRFTDLRPDHTRPVQVLVDGEWLDGWLEAVRRDDDGRWWGWVRWSVGVGLLHVGWFGEGAIGPSTPRKREE
jgi:hypothetical protein